MQYLPFLGATGLSGKATKKRCREKLWKFEFRVGDADAMMAREGSLQLNQEVIACFRFVKY